MNRQGKSTTNLPPDVAPSVLVEPRPPSEGALHAWFDAWVWVQLTQARLDPSHELRPSLEKLEKAVLAGRLQIVLGSGNYLEIWNRSGRRSRAEVARTMANLTGYVTIRAVHEIVDLEAEEVVRKWRVSPGTQPAALPRRTVFGLGVRHAFASETGRFRFVESIATESEPEGAEMPAPDELLGFFEKLSPAEFEWVNLVGVDDGHDIPGIDYRPTHREGDEWASLLNQFVRRVRERSNDSETLYRGLVGRQLTILLEQSRPLQDATDDLRYWLKRPPDGIRLLESMPVSRVMTQLINSTLQDRTYRIRQHDRVDVQELAAALPFCDVVVPDRHWAHQARSIGLAQAFDTRIVMGRRGLADWAASL